MKILISLITIISLILSFFLLVFFVNIFPDYVSSNEKNFFKRDIVVEQSEIFILGASGMGGLNSTHINYEIKKQDENIEIFNLAKGGDLPKNRIHTLNEMINREPKLILYGIDFRDFELEDENKPLPEPKKIFSNIIPINDYDLEALFFNPRLVTQQNLQNLLDLNKNNDRNKFFLGMYSPLISYENMYQISTEEKLLSEYYTSGSLKIRIDDSSENINLKSLEKMIEVFQSNDIEIKIITIPHHKVFFDGLDLNEEEKFNKILTNLKEKYNIDVYFLNHKYENLPIWANTNHIALNSNSMIFTNDIIEIIENSLS